MTFDNAQLLCARLRVGGSWERSQGLPRRSLLIRDERLKGMNVIPLYTQGGRRAKEREAPRY